MGVIARMLTPVGLETRNDPGWLTRGDDGDMGIPTAAGVNVSRASAIGMTTVWRCVDLLTSAIAQAPKDVIIKIGGQSFPEHTPPQWLSDPHPGDPNYTASDYFAEIAISLLLDGNYFVSVFPHIFDPQVLTVLDPQLVHVDSATEFTVKDRSGRIIGTYNSMTMLHGWWMKLPGTLRGISPLESLRRSIGGAIAAEQFAASFFGQGTTLAFGVEVPIEMKKEQKDEFRANLKADLSGLQKAHGVGVLTNGAKFITGLAPTPEQAQMLLTRQFSVEDLCRPFGVPPHMAGSQQPGAVSYASVEGTLLEFKQYAALPLALRIEAGHNRLVAVPDTITSPGATAQFKFNLDGIARADLLTRYQAYSAGILGGFLTPDEVRVDEDMAPKGGNASELFMQTQMQPIATATLIPQVTAGLISLDEARANLKLPPMAWAEGPSSAEITTLVEQVKSGLMTLDEARARINLPPLQWADGPSTDEVSSLIEQVKSGLRTHDEARTVIGLPPMDWPEGPSPDEMSSLLEQLKAGVLTHDEVRQTIKRPPIKWADGLGSDEVDSLIAQVKAGLLTENEARALMDRPPMEWADGPSQEEVNVLVAQIKEGLLTIDEARESLGRKPIAWPEDLSEKVSQASDLIKAGFDPEDVMTHLGLPPIKHLGLPPVTVQKVADAEGIKAGVTPPVPIPGDDVPQPGEMTPSDTLPTAGAPAEPAEPAEPATPGHPAEPAEPAEPMMP